MITFSESAKSMRSSEIRRLMSMAADPSVISFAGGMPNNNLFPVDLAAELYNSLSLAEKQAAFQYGPTAGYPPLLEQITRYLTNKGIDTVNNSLMITTGAQQAIHILTKVLIDPGDVIITEYPSFIGALAAFKSYGAVLHSANLTDDGIVIDELRELLQRLDGPRLKMVYLNPCFQNPAGTLYSTERKKEVFALLREHPDVCLLEDDPYSELYFDDSDADAVLPVKTMAGEQDNICYVGSLSKVFGPGMRLGYLLAPKGIGEKCELAKQSIDACSSSFTQVLANAYMNGGHFESYVAELRKTYKRRAEIMLAALEANMPADVSWTKPRGGFYIWVTLPDRSDATEVFDAALKEGAAFVIGSAFDPYGEKNNCFRLAFSHTPEEQITKGVEIVCRAVKQVLNEV